MGWQLKDWLNPGHLVTYRDLTEQVTSTQHQRLFVKGHRDSNPMGVQLAHVILNPLSLWMQRKANKQAGAAVNASKCMSFGLSHVLFTTGYVIITYQNPGCKSLTRPVMFV